MKSLYAPLCVERFVRDFLVVRAPRERADADERAVADERADADVPL